MKNYPLPSKISWWRLPEWLDKLTTRVEALEDAPATPVAPYKIYTALLTQSGGDNPIGVAGDGEVINVGVTYEITDNPDNYDLTIYGSPNNSVGTFFIANQTIALPYTNSLQLLGNTGAPVVTVLENIIGNVYWTYDSIGFYTGHSEELFTDNKSFALISSSTMGPIVTNISVYDSSSALIVASAEDGYRENFIAYVEIRVYN